jgi:hypothetical protein
MANFFLKHLFPNSHSAHHIMGGHRNRRLQRSRCETFHCRVISQLSGYITIGTTSDPTIATTGGVGTFIAANTANGDYFHCTPGRKSYLHRPQLLARISGTSQKWRET